MIKKDQNLSEIKETLMTMLQPIRTTKTVVFNTISLDIFVFCSERMFPEERILPQTPIVTLAQTSIRHRIFSIPRFRYLH